MSLADDVLARHVEAFCNLCEPTHSRGTCRVCFTEAWPCEAVRLATQLRAAEQVAAFLFDQSVQLTGNETHVRYVLTLRGFADWLAEYDKGGQG
jgi:hypothetical protein